MATAGATVPEVSPRELLREHGALLTLRPAAVAGAAAEGALAAAALALPLLGLVALALLLAPAPAPEVEWPAERLREKGHMLMLMSSALPLTLLTRRSAFLARSLDSPVALKMSFHLKVTAGRSGVGTAQASASGWTCSAASPSCSGGSEGSLTSASWSWSASSTAAWSWPWCWSASGPAGGAWRVWSGRTMPSEKSWSAVSRAGEGKEPGFLPTIQNSNSGDAVGDGEERPDSGGGDASPTTTTSIARRAMQHGLGWDGTWSTSKQAR
uniref:Predicted protein n=1 Tax=Hordeum vulgare subsp. vulgare TaxID=112509 RepID=F2EBZ9_HORVV|nr:predicted protein [Hordeum vulgare subsp. vulgare]